MIDLIFSKSDSVGKAEVLDLNLSDHLAIRINRKKIKVKVERVEFRGRSYRNYDKDRFQRRLENKNWEGLFESEDPNELWEIMENFITRNIDEMCPLKSFKVSSLREPWITNEAIEAIQDKDRLLRHAKRTGKEDDWARARRVRNMVGRGDPKKIWRTIGSILPNGKKDKEGIWLRDEGTGKEIKPDGVPAFINEFFTGIGPKLASKFNDRWAYFGTRNPHKMEDMVTNYEEVLQLCKGINSMKSSGLTNFLAE